MRLEELTPGAMVRGLVAGVTVKVLQVGWFGDQAAKVTFEEPNGAVCNRLVYRSDEDSLELVGPGRAWSFSGDGYLFRLASEAQRIRLAICSIRTLRCRPHRPAQHVADVRATPSGASFRASSISR